MLISDGQAAEAGLSAQCGCSRGVATVASLIGAGLQIEPNLAQKKRNLQQLSGSFITAAA